MQRAVALFAQQLARQPTTDQIRLLPVLRGLASLAGASAPASLALQLDQAISAPTLLTSPSCLLSKQSSTRCAACQQGFQPHRPFAQLRSATNSPDFAQRGQRREVVSGEEEDNSLPLDQELETERKTWTDAQNAELDEWLDARESLEPELCTPTREEVERQLDGMYEDYDDDEEGEPQYDGVYNTAGNNQPAWEIADVDQSICATYWHWDLIGGQVFENEKNALLSDEAKKGMWVLYKHTGLSEKTLSKMFRIRQQRVMAIIALKQMEADAEASGRLKADEEDEFQVLMETEVYDCIESQGVGEQYIVTSASFPKQEEDGSVTGDKPEEMAAQSLNDRAAAIRMEKLMVKEFKQRLDYNLGNVLDTMADARTLQCLVATSNGRIGLMQTGTKLERASRASKLPKRPQQGWSLVVRRKGREGIASSYVANPDGSQREPSADENLLLLRATPKKRSAIQ